MSEWRTCQIGEIADLIQGLAINAQSKHLILNDDKGPAIPAKIVNACS